MAQQLTGGRQAQISTDAGTGNIAQAQRVVDMDERIHLLEPNATPLAVLLMRLRKKVTFNPRFDWLEDDLRASWTTLAEALDNVETAVDVATGTGAYFRANDIVKIPETQEVMLVVSIATDTLTVVRGFGETAAAAATNGGQIVLIGNINEEFATIRGIKTTTKSNVFNYTQIFRTPFSVSGTLNESRLYGGDELVYQRKKSALDHMVDVERSFLLGERREDLTGTPNGQPRRMTRGVRTFVASNVTNVGGAMTDTQWEGFIRDGMRFGSAQKILFASRLVNSVISGYGRAKLEQRPADDTFGISVTRYVSPHGQIAIVNHNLLEGNVYGGEALLLDIEDLMYRPMNNRDTKLRINVQAPSADGQQDEFLTEAGLQLNNEAKHARLVGVTG